MAFLPACAMQQSGRYGFDKGGLYNTSREIREFFEPKLYNFNTNEVYERAASLRAEEQEIVEAINKAEQEGWVIGDQTLDKLHERTEAVKRRREAFNQEMQGRIYVGMIKDDFYKLCGAPANRSRSTYEDERVEIWEYGNLRTGLRSYIQYYFVFQNGILKSWHN